MEYLDYTNGDDQVNTAIEGGSAPDLIMEAVSYTHLASFAPGESS